MLRMLPTIGWLLLLSGIIGALSCNRTTAEQQPISADSSYFSINGYIKDQIHTLYGSPLSLYRIRHIDGGVDTTLVNFFNMDWSFILKTFGATDISARKMIGKYAFSVYDDGLTGNRGYTYTATDPDVFTRLFQINTDPSNNRITSIYIEAAHKDFFGSKSQKLLYIPLRIIQIQETEGRLFRKARNLRVDYKFMQEDEVEQI